MLSTETAELSVFSIILPQISQFNFRTHSVLHSKMAKPQVKISLLTATLHGFI